ARATWGGRRGGWAGGGGLWERPTRKPRPCHYQGAGDATRARRHFIRAAEHAVGTLAFDRAVKLYRHSLKLGPVDEGEERRLRTQLGHALVNAGRGAEAAQQYRAASAGATPEAAVELKKLATGQFFLSGQIDEGFATLATLRRVMGLTIPSTPRRTLLALLCRRAQLWLRGTRFRQRPASAVP